MAAKRDFNRHLTPDRHGRWVNNDPDRIMYLQDLGYRIERNDPAAKDAKNPKVGDAGALLGAITSGGDVLMSCDRDEYDARQEYRNQMVEEQLRGPRETFKTEASKHDVEVDDHTKSKRGLITDVLKSDGNPKNGED
jgi:hypothetical protein